MIGTRLQDRYIIEKILGAGAMGEVFLAADETSGSQVAIKALPSHLASNPTYLLRFEREAQALRDLNHPNIVPFIDSFEEDNRYYLIMAYMLGGNLYQRIQQDGALPVEDARRIAIDLTDALIRAHRLGIIHRDIKPENILFDDQGTARLSDFGIAGMVDSERNAPDGDTGAIGDTLLYVAGSMAW